MRGVFDTTQIDPKDSSTTQVYSNKKK